TLPDIEDEVMCTICGTLLEMSSSPQADRERHLIQVLIDQGKTKQQIEDVLVAQYGPNVLATPSDSGFDLTAWLVPVLALGAALTARIVFWRRLRRRGPDRPPPPQLDPADSQRLDADLAEFDR